MNKYVLNSSRAIILPTNMYMLRWKLIEMCTLWSTMTACLGHCWQCHYLCKLPLTVTQWRVEEASHFIFWTHKKICFVCRQNETSCCVGIIVGLVLTTFLKTVRLILKCCIAQCISSSGKIEADLFVLISWMGHFKMDLIICYKWSSSNMLSVFKTLRFM